MIDPSSFPSVVKIANLAPSVCNTQPTKWQLLHDGRTQSIRLYADLDKRLEVGDPTGRDLLISMGAALQGTIHVLNTLGRRGRPSNPVALDLQGDVLQPIVELDVTRGDDKIDELSAMQSRRITWRRNFVPTDPKTARRMHALIEGHSDAELISDATTFAHYSDLNDRTGLALHRNDAWRSEMLHWMRTSWMHDRLGHDGLSYSALGMSAAEGIAAGIVLRKPFFSAIDAMKLLPFLLNEGSRTDTALCMIAFHRPIDEHPVRTGQAMYFLLLQLAQLNLMTWPMSVLANDAEASREIVADLGIPDDRRLVTVWRVGSIPPSTKVKRERLDPGKLIVS